MTSNPYLPPSAPLDVISSGQDSRFYTVSETKFWVLYILSLGMYQLYWNFKHWSNYKAATNENIWPVARAIFSIFFYHKLNAEIQAQAIRSQIALRWDHKMIATLMVVSVLANSVLSRLGEKMMGVIAANILVLLVIAILGYLMSVVQKAANVVNGDPNGSQNSNFTPANYAWIVLFIFIWGFSILGVWVALNPE
jgi:hypothetical protein